MANTASEVIWLTHLLHDLRVSLIARPVILCDNKAAVFISTNPVSHKRAKHIELDYHYTRDLVLAVRVVTQFVPTGLNVADVFTKSLSRPLFLRFRSKLRIDLNPTLSLRGAVNDVQDST